MVKQKTNPIIVILLVIAVFYFGGIERQALVGEVQFRTSDLSYGSIGTGSSSDSIIYLNLNCDGQELTRHSVITANILFDPCNQLGNPILIGLPGSPNPNIGGQSDLYFYQNGYFVCGEGYYTRYSGSSSGTESSLSTNPANEVEMSTRYVPGVFIS